MSTTTPPELEGFGQYKFGWHDPAHYVFTPKKGLNADVVREISFLKNEPEWMTKFRLRSLEIFERKPMPTWGSDLSDIDFQDIFYFIRASERQGENWDDVPADIKNTFDRLGIPEAEQKFLSGVSAQYESEVVYHSIREDLEKKGVIFCDTDTALREHEELFRQYWATDHPARRQQARRPQQRGVVGRIVHLGARGRRGRNSAAGLFPDQRREHGPVRAHADHRDEGAYVHYVEGCTAPIYTTDSLHSAVVEIIVKEGARCRYSTIQNWSTNVYNLVTKRAVAHADATMEWVDGNLGSKMTMKYPAVWLIGRGARGEVLSVAFASEGSTRTPAPRWSMSRRTRPRRIISKSISRGGGRTYYRGLSRSSRARTGPGRPSSATRCCWTRTAAPTPTPTWTSRKRRRSAMRRPCRRSPTTRSFTS